MTKNLFEISPQSDTHHQQVEQLLDASFGLDRRTKASYRLRETEKEISGLSYVAKSVEQQIIGTISFWHIFLGDNGMKAILLGPLAVHPQWQSSGIGMALMQEGIKAAKLQNHKLVILIGDAPYYQKIGFKQVPENQLLMPGPNDPARLMYLEITPGVLGDTSGLIRSPLRYRTAPFFSNPGSK